MERPNQHVGPKYLEEVEVATVPEVGLVDYDENKQGFRRRCLSPKLPKINRHSASKTRQCTASQRKIALKAAVTRNMSLILADPMLDLSTITKAPFNPSRSRTCSSLSDLSSDFFFRSGIVSSSMLSKTLLTFLSESEQETSLKPSHSGSSSPLSQLQSPSIDNVPAPKVRDVSATPSGSSERSHQPAPAASIPRYQTFGDNPLTFDDPTIYHVREADSNTMTDEELKAIYCVSVFPHDDLHDLTAGTPPDADFSNAKPSNQVAANTFQTYIEPYLRQCTDEDIAWLKDRVRQGTQFFGFQVDLSRVIEATSSRSMLVGSAAIARSGMKKTAVWQSIPP